MCFGSAPSTDSLMTLQVLPARYLFDSFYPLTVSLSLFTSTMSAPLQCHHRLSSTASHAPTTILVHSGLSANSPVVRFRCVLTVINGGFPFPCSFSIRSSLISRVLSSTLLPGFFGPESSVLSVNLPPSVPCRLGFASSARFYRVNDSS